MAVNFGGTLFSSLCMWDVYGGGCVCTCMCMSNGGCVKDNRPVETCKGKALPSIENHCVCVCEESASRWVRSPKMGLSVPLEWVLGPSTSPSRQPLTQFRPPSSVTCVDSSNLPTCHPASCLPSANPWPSPAPFLPVHCQLAASLVTSQLRGSCCPPRSLSSLPARHLVLCTGSASLGFFFRPSSAWSLCLEGGGQTHLSDPKGCCTQSGP